MRISDWSSDVCSSDLDGPRARRWPHRRPRHPAPALSPGIGQPPPRTRAAGIRRNGGVASATVGAADAQKKPGNLRCRVSTRERDRVAGFPADGADYLGEALVAPLPDYPALAGPLAVGRSPGALGV